MNYFRRRADQPATRQRPTQEQTDSGSVDRELTEEAADIYAVADQHRKRIIKREAAFKARTTRK
jgi:hypothetical protein